jgi:hypothetical protein
MRTVWRYHCRLCARPVTQLGGHRRRFCDDCLRLLANRFRRLRRGRFARRPAGIRRSR